MKKISSTKSSILNAGQMNILPSPRVSGAGLLSSTGRFIKLLCVALLLINIVAVKAQTLSLANSPVNSRLTIVVANLTTGLLDKTVVGFNPNSTDSFNTIYDANKLAGLPTRQTLYTLNSGEWMSINILPNEATTDTVAMGMEPGSNATFTFTFTGLNTFDSTSYIYLEDKKTHTWFNTRNGIYTFTMLTTDDWNRFLIHFTPPSVLTEANTTCSAASTVNIQQPGMAYWNYTLNDSTNNSVATGVVNANLPATLKVYPGTYNLILTDTNGYSAEKTIQVVGPVPVNAMSFTLSDTAVQLLQPLTLTDAAIVNDSTQAAGITYQWNFGNGTTGTGIDTTITYTQAGVYTIGLTVTNLSGCSATQTQTLTVNDTTVVIDTIPVTTTGITAVTGRNKPQIWSNGNRIYTDFTALQMVDATVTIYNILGQEISNEHYSNSTVYQKEVDDITAAYMIVKVSNNHETFVKKVFISNAR